MKIIEKFYQTLEEKNGNNRFYDMGIGRAIIEGLKPKTTMRQPACRECSLKVMVVIGAGLSLLSGVDSSRIDSKFRLYYIIPHPISSRYSKWQLGILAQKHSVRSPNVHIL